MVRYLVDCLIHVFVYIFDLLRAEINCHFEMFVIEGDGSI